jgi:glycosyltransferase involved in cell wall biosynthesis
LGRAALRATPREEVMKLFEQADCFLFPTRGEGFGLPPLEAMATGLPTILADHSGMADFCDDRYNYPIRKNKVTPAFRYPKNWGKVGNWFEPDYEELKDLMLYVFDNQEEARTKGKEASDWVLKNWTMDNTADSIISELEKVEQKIK